VRCRRRDGLKPVAPTNPVLDVRPGSATRSSVRESAPRSSAKSWVRITRTATQRSTTPWCEWCRTSRCATRSSAATETSEAPDRRGCRRMRYTECRLAPLALELLDSIDEETVDFEANYDNSTQHRRCCRRASRTLGQRLPRHRRGHGDEDPTHNLGEVIDATLHLLGTGATADDLMASCGSDFPTGAQILDEQESWTRIAVVADRSRCAPSPRSKRRARMSHRRHRVPYECPSSRLRRRSTTS